MRIIFLKEVHAILCQVPINIFELGLKNGLLQEPQYVIAYADFLLGEIQPYHQILYPDVTRKSSRSLHFHASTTAPLIYAPPQMAFLHKVWRIHFSTDLSRAGPLR